MRSPEPSPCRAATAGTRWPRLPRPDAKSWRSTTGRRQWHSHSCDWVRSCFGPKSFRPKCRPGSPPRRWQRRWSRPACAPCIPTAGPLRPRRFTAGFVRAGVCSHSSPRRRATGPARGFVEGTPYHCNIHAMRAPSRPRRRSRANRPTPRLHTPGSMVALAVILTRRRATKMTPLHAPANTTLED
jgi:hypothetical protein